MRNAKCERDFNYCDWTMNMTKQIPSCTVFTHPHAHFETLTAIGFSSNSKKKWQNRDICTSHLFMMPFCKRQYILNEHQHDQWRSKERHRLVEHTFISEQNLREYWTLNKFYSVSTWVCIVTRSMKCTYYINVKALSLFIFDDSQFISSSIRHVYLYVFDGYFISQLPMICPVYSFSFHFVLLCLFDFPMFSHSECCSHISNGFFPLHNTSTCFILSWELPMLRPIPIEYGMDDTCARLCNYRHQHKEELSQQHKTQQKQTWFWEFEMRWRWKHGRLQSYEIRYITTKKKWKQNKTKRKKIIST